VDFSTAAKASCCRATAEGTYYRYAKLMLLDKK